ncbi:death-associated protein kinase 1-like [Ptychodera flava]|uniref:death-associated protein kinase 1-like n=1 Tax=Ptychodera flava TaxID=63121 RepID=UPI00396A56F6
MTGITKSTALHLASEQGHVDVAQMLIKCGADVNAKDKDGLTPVHHAAIHGYEATVRLLLKCKSVIDAQTKEGYTPLHLAAMTGREKTTKLLLEYKASVDLMNYIGQTPLHWAATSGRDVTTKLLLEYNASFEVQDKYGKTPLDVANGRRVKSLLKAAKKKAEFSVLMREPGVTRNSSKLSVCGYGGVGKTTLVNALQRGVLKAYCTRRSEEKAPSKDKATHIPTPGIDVNIVNIPKVGHYIIWDYAGQPEYYVTHNMFLRVDETVFINVFKIMDVMDGFDGTLTEKLLTWPRFIKSRRSDDLSTENKPMVILLASGADLVDESRRDRAIKIIEDIRTKIQEMFGAYLNIVDETYLINCHDSRHTDIKDTRLRKCLSNAKIIC